MPVKNDNPLRYSNRQLNDEHPFDKDRHSDIDLTSRFCVTQLPDVWWSKPSANLPYSQRIWNKEIMERSRIFDYFFERLSTFSNISAWN